MTATELERPAHEVVDLSDLDLLDDPHRHAACNACYPSTLPAGTVFVASCGRRALATGRSDSVTPPNACPDCVIMRVRACPRCGL